MVETPRLQAEGGFSLLQPPLIINPYSNLKGRMGGRDYPLTIGRVNSPSGIKVTLAFGFLLNS